MYSKKVLYSCISFLAASVLFGQEHEQISFNQLSVEDGLSQNSVISIAQDSIGHLWFATQDGLNKYNGKTFAYYPKYFEDITNGYKSKLGKLYIDRQNTLYTITLPGNLEKYNRKVDSFQSISRFKKPSAIFQDHANTLWIGTYGNGLHAIRKKDTTQILKSTDLSRDIYALFQNNNSLFVAASGSVFQVNATTQVYTALTISEEFSEVNFSSLAIDTKESLWIGSYGYGLFKKETNSNSVTQFTGFSEKERLPTSLNIEAILFDSKNRLWIATYGNGAYVLDVVNQTISHFLPNETLPNSLNYEDVLCIFEDFSGTIWLGTDGARSVLLR